MMVALAPSSSALSHMLSGFSQVQIAPWGPDASQKPPGGLQLCSGRLTAEDQHLTWCCAALCSPGNKTPLIKITAQHGPANESHLITANHPQKRKRRRHKEEVKGRVKSELHQTQGVLSQRVNPTGTLLPVNYAFDPVWLQRVPNSNQILILFHSLGEHRAEKPAVVVREVWF